MFLVSKTFTTDLVVTWQNLVPAVVTRHLTSSMQWGHVEAKLITPAGRSVIRTGLKETLNILLWRVTAT